MESQRNPLRQGLARQPVEVFQQGHMLVPDRPGIGLGLHETVVNRYRV